MQKQYLLLAAACLNLFWTTQIHAATSKKLKLPFQLAPIDVVAVKLKTNHDPDSESPRSTLLFRLSTSLVHDSKTAKTFYALDLPGYGLVLIPGSGNDGKEKETYSLRYEVDGLRIESKGELFEFDDQEKELSFALYAKNGVSHELIKEYHLVKDPKPETKIKEKLDFYRHYIERAYQANSTKVRFRSLEQRNHLEAFWSWGQNEIKPFTGNYELYQVFWHPYLPHQKLLVMLGPSISNSELKKFPETALFFTEFYEGTPKDGWKQVSYTAFQRDSNGGRSQYQLVFEPGVTEGNLVHETLHSSRVILDQWWLQEESSSRGLEKLNFDELSSTLKGIYLKSLTLATGYTFKNQYQPFQEFDQLLNLFPSIEGPGICNLGLHQIQ